MNNISRVNNKVMNNMRKYSVFFKSRLKKVASFLLFCLKVHFTLHVVFKYLCDAGGRNVTYFESKMNF